MAKSNHYISAEEFISTKLKRQSVFDTLKENGPCSIGQLQELTHFCRTTIGDILQKFWINGLVKWEYKNQEVKRMGRKEKFWSVK